MFIANFPWSQDLQTKTSHNSYFCGIESESSWSCRLSFTKSSKSISSASPKKKCCDNPEKQGKISQHDIFFSQKKGQGNPTPSCSVQSRPQCLQLSFCNRMAILKNVSLQNVRWFFGWFSVVFIFWWWNVERFLRMGSEIMFDVFGEVLIGCLLVISTWANACDTCMEIRTTFFTQPISYLQYPTKNHPFHCFQITLMLPNVKWMMKHHHESCLISCRVILLPTECLNRGTWRGSARIAHLRSKATMRASSLTQQTTMDGWSLHQFSGR